MNPTPPIAAALRVFDRAVDDYRRAFDVAAGDGPYIRSDYFNDVKSRGKDALVVLKRRTARSVAGCQESA